MRSNRGNSHIFKYDYYPYCSSNDEKVLKIQIDARSENYVVALDSRSYSLPLDATLKITKTPHTIKLIRLNNHTFLTTLRSKLMWGIDKRN